MNLLRGSPQPGTRFSNFHLFNELRGDKQITLGSIAFYWPVQQDRLLSLGGTLAVASGWKKEIE
jgi:hypothetical protein